jgi:acetolactate synthase-1/3 small subunit
MIESKHTVSVLVDNEPGVLARVIGLISGRGYNIDSLSVAEVDTETHVSRITFVTLGNEITINKMIAQLQKLIPVKKAINITLDKQGIERELALDCLMHFEQKLLTQLMIHLYLN